MRMELIKKVIAIAAVIIVSCNCFACNCMDEEDINSHIQHADIVFGVKVISKIITTNYDSLNISTTQNSSNSIFNWQEIASSVVKIKVDKIFKGQAKADTIIIITPAYSASCGINFKQNEKYILYATLVDEISLRTQVNTSAFRNSVFWTNECTRTQAWNSTEENEIVNFIKSSKK
jgi:predicted Zn-ribbon and HTH transcriptional regulator